MNSHDRHGKKDAAAAAANNVTNGALKVSRESHFIKKSSAAAASSLGVSGTVKPPPQQQRHPVIIYTHSPKVIHTHPKDFMALVQKLTGLSRNEEDHHHHQNHQSAAQNNVAASHQPKAEASAEEDSKRIINNNNNDDNDSSSVITDENSEGQVNSCFVPPLFDPPAAAPFLTNIPIFTPNSADFLCVNHHQPFYNYTDSLFFTPNMRSSISSSSSGLEGMNEFRDY
ncbi:VQ motif-containing protein 8 [Hibiscus syriacus]|uniref:VQ motif-containing protein 8 n=1 Tax=Hibiscus syriacus TaxID=106335 RepID=A0A6A3BYC0_HIBSY|nr:VQ motif-containing protein 20-like [Hibiscus syriacus]KAE8721683.1 VQ motif-containing protein 8 [Hibiscus syriacus]